MHVTIEDKNNTDRDGVKHAGDHQYYILEPQTNQPVNNIRRVSDEEEIQYYSPNHEYFILEPDTNTLKPVDIATQMTDRKPDHIYFVLEKQPETPYMVSGLSVDDPNVQYLTKSDENS